MQSKVTFEVGRELKAADLVHDTVVAMVPPGYDDVVITMWVMLVDFQKSLVLFFSGERKLIVAISIQPDGSLIDDQGRVVKVCEWRGTI
jgi:hypothetical protein